MGLWDNCRLVGSLRWKLALGLDLSEVIPINYVPPIRVAIQHGKESKTLGMMLPAAGPAQSVFGAQADAGFAAAWVPEPALRKLRILIQASEASSAE